MAELEDDFGIAHGKAIDVGDSPPQDKGVVVETEVGSVAESDFANFAGGGSALGSAMKPTPVLLGYFLHQLAEIAKGVHGSETVGLQDQLGFQVGDIVERRAVSVGLSCRLTGSGADCGLPYPLPSYSWPCLCLLLFLFLLVLLILSCPSPSVSLQERRHAFAGDPLPRMIAMLS